MIPSGAFSSDPRNFPYLQCAARTDKVKRGREETAQPMLSHLYILPASTTQLDASIVAMIQYNLSEKKTIDTF